MKILCGLFSMVQRATPGRRKPISAEILHPSWAYFDGRPNRLRDVVGGSMILPQPSAQYGAMGLRKAKSIMAALARSFSSVMFFLSAGKTRPRAKARDLWREAHCSSCTA